MVKTVIVSPGTKPFLFAEFASIATSPGAVGPRPLPS
jgi:hypothetical protein